MSYCLHITKAKNWFESESNPVTQQEWDAIVSADFELSAQEAHVASAQNPKTGETIAMPVPSSAVWSKDGEVAGVFWFSKGKIFTKSPSDAAIGKMKQIAAKLSAVVQGDEGESY